MVDIGGREIRLASWYPLRKFKNLNPLSLILDLHGAQVALSKVLRARYAHPNAKSRRLWPAWSCAILKKGGD